MKKNEKIIIIILSALAVILSVILICMLSCGGGGVIEDTLISPAPTVLDPGGVVVHDPGAGSTTAPEQGGTTGEIVIWLDDPVPTNAPVEAGATAAPGADPVSGHTPDDDGPGGVSSGHGHTGEYHCGTPGHHCDSPETHAYILNLEAQGCPYCGRHDCPSFYAVDEWGTACYDPTKCPQYDVHLDPVYYCQHCHKPCGDGTNGTCVRFVDACHCPICGKWVEAFTCHSCEQ